MRRKQTKSGRREPAKCGFCRYMAQIEANFPSKSGLRTKNPWDVSANPWDASENPRDKSGKTQDEAAGQAHGDTEILLKSGQSRPSALTVCHIAHTCAHATEKPQCTPTPRRAAIMKKTGRQQGAAAPQRATPEAPRPHRGRHQRHSASTEGDTRGTPAPQRATPEAPRPHRGRHQRHSASTEGDPRSTPAPQGSNYSITAGETQANPRRERRIRM